MKKSVKQVLLASILAISMVTFSACGDKPSPKTDDISLPDTSDIVNQIEDSDALDTLEEDPDVDGMRVYDSDNEDEGKLVSNAVLGVDGKTIKFPMTMQQLIELGFESTSDITKMIEPNQMNMGGNKLIYGSDDTTIQVSVHNLTDAPLAISECVVTELWTESDKISLNNIKPKVSTYAEVLEVYGKDHSNRITDFQKEIDANDVLVNLAYNTDEIKGYYNTTDADFIRLHYDMETDADTPDLFGKVRNTTYSFNYTE